MKEIKFRVHTLHQQMQLVMSCLAMGQHGQAFLACREGVKVRRTPHFFLGG